MYALCRSYDSKPVINKNERQITLGIETEPIIVSKSDIFKDKRKQYVARLQVVGRDNGIIIGSIQDVLKQKEVYRNIPLDDLVKEEDLKSLR
jgi:hypothetical protein